MSELIFVDNLNGGLKNEWFRETALPENICHKDPESKNAPYCAILNRDDDIVLGSKRTEIALHQNQILIPGQEKIIMFKMFLPATGAESFEPDQKDGKPTGSEILAQFHNVPDVEDGRTEDWTTPPWFLKTYGDKYVIGTAWDDSRFTTTDQMKTKQRYKVEILDTSFLPDRGKWIDWMIRLKWGWLPEHDAFIRLYKNRELFWESDGPNTTNDKYENQFKMGIYKWDWSQPNYGGSSIERRVVYYKDVAKIDLPF